MEKGWWRIIRLFFKSLAKEKLCISKVIDTYTCLISAKPKFVKYYIFLGPLIQCISNYLLWRTFLFFPACVSAYVSFSVHGGPICCSIANDLFIVYTNVTRYAILKLTYTPFNETNRKIIIWISSQCQIVIKVFKCFILISLIILS